MSKKIVIFLALMISVLSIMSLAIFGTGSEQTSTIVLESIIIPESEYDHEFTVEGKSEKYKNMTGLVSEANPSYVIHYTIEPHNATTSITVTKDPSSGVVDILHNPEDKTVTVIYNPSVIGKTSGTVTITIKADEQRKDSITLMFGSPSEVDIPDDPFGP